MYDTIQTIKAVRRWKLSIKSFVLVFFNSTEEKVIHNDNGEIIGDLKGYECGRYRKFSKTLS